MKKSVNLLIRKRSLYRPLTIFLKRQWYICGSINNKLIIKDDSRNTIYAQLHEDSDKLVPIVENNSYAAKQVLRKLCALIHPSDFLYIYSDSAIDALHKEFIGSEETTNLGKSFKIRSFFGEVFSVDSSPEENILLSRFLWKYATTKGLADKATPNVILYGPPGTGKTFSVKSSLDFLCKGDRERYEFVQFHPSFTYEDFIEGIKPKGVSADGNIKFELVDGIFKRFCKKAKLHLGGDGK